MSDFLHAFSMAEKDGILIVSPLGDSVSFRPTHLKSDLGTIKSHMKVNELWKVVIDLGAASYFGSIMIGMFNDIGRYAAENGGQMVMCDASVEMAEIMRVMKISDLWPCVPKKAQAIQVLKVWKE